MASDISQEWMLSRVRSAALGDENAFHSLLEAPQVLLDALRSSWTGLTDPMERAIVVEVLWHQRDPRDAPLLEAALDDLEAEVWKQVLDGLITLGACATLETALESLAPSDPRAANTAGHR